MVDLPVGIHEHKYIVDGKWQYDNKKVSKIFSEV
jgi:hypothetical protein